MVRAFARRMETAGTVVVLSESFESGNVQNGKKHRRVLGAMAKHDFNFHFLYFTFCKSNTTLAIPTKAGI